MHGYRPDHHTLAHERRRTARWRRFALSCFLFGMVGWALFAQVVRALLEATP